MNYSKLKNIIEEKGYTIRQIAESIEITEAGFHKMIRNESMKVGTLERICSVVGINPATLWSENNVEIAAEPSIEYGKLNKKEKELMDLYRENRGLYKENKKLNDELNEIREECNCGAYEKVKKRCAS